MLSCFLVVVVVVAAAVVVYMKRKFWPHWPIVKLERED
jgi:hypothetical protein